MSDWEYKKRDVLQAHLEALNASIANNEKGAARIYRRVELAKAERERVLQMLKELDKK